MLDETHWHALSARLGEEWNGIRNMDFRKKRTKKGTGFSQLRQLCILPLLLFSLNNACGQKEDSTVDLFKAFLQERPVVKQIIFQRQNLAVPQLPPDVKLPNSFTNDIQYYQGAWQSNAFFLRRVWAPDDIDRIVETTNSTAGLLFAGRAQEQSWYIVDTNVYYGNSTGAGEDPIAPTTRSAEEILASLLSFGVERMIPGTLTWQGNNFTTTVEGGTKAHGSLEISNNLPIRLAVTYEGADFKRVTEYVYSADKRLPFGLPNELLQTFVQSQSPLPQKRETILSVEGQREELPLEFFRPERFIATKVREVIYTNGALYEIKGGKLGEKLSDLPEWKPLPARKKKANFAMYGMMGAATVGLLIFFAVTVKKQKPSDK